VILLMKEVGGNINFALVEGRNLLDSYFRKEAQE